MRNRHSGITDNDEVPSTFPQTVEKIEAVKEVVWLEVFKLTDSVINKNDRDQVQFSPERKTLEKAKWICCLLHLLFSATLTGGTCKKKIDESVL